MSGKHIEELLQQCLMAFDAGSEPEECLSAFPDARAELEPLFRQAVSLRVAFAASPRPEFRAHARERLMFMAGRDVSAALSSRPAPEFINDARQRFIRAAGADAQELLRNVPPPRLPFWVNARRRLLDAAAATPPQPAPQRSGVFALRYGLSAAVVALAIALAGLGYMAGFGGQTRGANAELAQLEHDLQEIEAQQLSGAVVSAAALQDLNDRTNKLLDQIDTNDAPTAVVDKLPELIERQKTVVLAAANNGVLAPELAQAQTQQLEQAEKAVDEIKQAAAQAPTSTVQAAATSTAVANETATAVTTPNSISTLAPTSTVEPLEDGQVRVTTLTNDIFANRTWKRIDTANLSVSVPASWNLVGVTIGAGGVGVFESDFLYLSESSTLYMLVNVETGKITVSAGTVTIDLRGSGINGELISPEELTERVGDSTLAAELRHIVESIELRGILAATPEPTSTPTAAPSATPQPSSTPPPSATP